MSNWIDVLSQAAASQYQEGRALLLAQVPRILAQGGVGNLRLIQGGRSLRETIATDAFDKLRLIVNPDDKLVWGVVPKSAHLPDDLRPYFDRKVSKISTAPRYKRWFWTAFIKQVPEGHKRYLFPHTFIDIPETEPSPGGAWPLDKTDILESSLTEPVSYDAVHEAIGKWAARTGADLTQYQITPAQKTSNVTAPTQLHRLFELDDNDLKRVMIPLDIVVKLLR